MGTFRLTVELRDRRPLAAMFREVADRIDATPPDRAIHGRIDTSGGTIGVYSLVVDDEAWQAMMRRHLEVEQG
jgi:hypothetical protein